MSGLAREREGESSAFAFEPRAFFAGVSLTKGRVPPRTKSYGLGDVVIVSSFLLLHKNIICCKMCKCMLVLVHDYMDQNKAKGDRAFTNRGC